MINKPTVPNTEQELISVLDSLYDLSHSSFVEGKRPKFVGLLEIVASDPVIHTAIRNCKKNRGSLTPGVDGETILKILHQNYNEVREFVKSSVLNYNPKMIRRKHIPKPGKNEKRPLGIPVIADRVIQECFKIVLEPIFEAQFFKHSYGFRPMRDASHAIHRIEKILYETGYNWVVEGDISKFFDNVNHTKLLRTMWHMGIRDKRVLMVIKSMLRAGVMDECKTSTIGTPQGGIISPLLANIYLDNMDRWISREWENKDLKTDFSRHTNKLRALRNTTNLKPAYLVRYADDWVLITDSKANAEKWKFRIQKHLKDELHLDLSAEKTLITDVSKKPITFIGFDIKKVRRETNKKGYITYCYPNKERLRDKMIALRKKVRKMGKCRTKEEAVLKLNEINSVVIGLQNYYSIANQVNPTLLAYNKTITYLVYKILKKEYGGKSIRANACSNLQSVLGNYTSRVPAIKYDEKWIGFVQPVFVKHKPHNPKNPEETPYSVKGRFKYQARTGKKPIKVRADELFDTSYSTVALLSKTNPKYNTEYIINRPYVFNRDKGACKICKNPVDKTTVQIHHNHPYLPITKVNKVQYLSTLCFTCHPKVHDNHDYSNVMVPAQWKRLLKFREKLTPNQKRQTV